MAHEINGAKGKRANGKWSKGNVIRLTPEMVKGKKFKELSVEELQELGEINASQDRFRHRYTEEDFANDLKRSDAPNVNLRWIN